MPEIPVRTRLSDRLETLVGDRRNTWALMAIVLVLGGGFLWMRSKALAPRIAPPSQSAATPIGLPVPTPTGGMLVHVAGAVKHPGLYEVPSGARVADAIEAAGGPLRAADLDGVNLAEPVMDGFKIDVPLKGKTPSLAAGVAGASGSPTPGSVVNINSADQAAWESIPGIGPSKAAAIIDFRTQAGGFTSVDQLLDVPGIGPSTLESIRPYVSL